MSLKHMLKKSKLQYNKVYTVITISFKTESNIIF